MNNWIFAAVTLAVAIALAAVTQLIPNEYFFSAAYTVLLFVILATASVSQSRWHRADQFPGALASG